MHKGLGASQTFHILISDFLGLLLPLTHFIHWKHLKTPLSCAFLHKSTSKHCSFSDLSVDALEFKSYDTIMELERQTFHKRELKRWWAIFSSKDWTYIKRFLRDATALFCTPLDWHLLEVIDASWDPALRYTNIGDMDLVPTMEEYESFLSLPTPIDQIY